MAELSGFKLNRAIAEALGYIVECCCPGSSVWTFYAPEPDGDDGRTWLSDVLAGSENEAWEKAWIRDSCWLPDWAHDADAAIGLCEGEIHGKRRRSFVLQYPYYDGRNRYVAYTEDPNKPAFFARGDMPAEALARLALMVLTNRQTMEGR